MTERQARRQLSARGLRALVVGMSDTPICGARDHASVLVAELESRGMSCSTWWLGDDRRSLLDGVRAVRAWVGELEARLAAEAPDLVLLHYSVFAFSYRGLPLFVHPVIAALRHARAPVVTVIHEAVYASRRGGPRGRLWAIAHRAALIEVMRCSAAVLVTADFRASWLGSRRWLATRPLAVAPVFSNLPVASAGSHGDRVDGLVGLFGYAYEGSAMTVVLDALALLRRRDLPAVRLVLLGAPGRDSAPGTAWHAAAVERGVGDAISFSGSLPAQELSDRLSACELLVFADLGGPSSRKGSLAAALASGSPVLALDGPYRWSELRDGDSIKLLERTPIALADAIAGLLSDRELKDDLGRRGRAFAEREMSVGRSAETLIELLDRVGVTA